jgi:hypothetical protein
MKEIYVIIIAFLLRAFSVSAQGGFQNLNFEAANIPAGTQAGTEVSSNAAIPGWSGSSPIIYDFLGSGGSQVAIIDSSFRITPLQGNYSVILVGGTDTGYNYPSYISQTGLVPANAQSIQMDLSVLGFPGVPYVIAINGQSISMSPLQTFPNYTVYGGNISAYAGQDATLSITQDAPVGEAAESGILEVDDIVFSPSSIPEPGSWALILCGAAALMMRRLKASWKRTG